MRVRKQAQKGLGPAGASSTLAGLRFKTPASTPSPCCPAQIANNRDLLCPLVGPARS